MPAQNYKPLTFTEILEVLSDAPFCRLAVAENNQPYIVPMNFSWDFKNHHVIFLLFSEESGEKMQCMHANPKVSLEFEAFKGCDIRTVVAKGEIVNFIPIERCHNSVVGIEIMSMSLSGRRYEMPFTTITV